MLTYVDAEKPADNDLVSWPASVRERNRRHCRRGHHRVQVGVCNSLRSRLGRTWRPKRHCIHDAGTEPVTFNLADIATTEDEEPLLAADDSEEPPTNDAPATDETDTVDSTTQRPETEVSNDATVDGEPVEYNLSKYRICLPFQRVANRQFRK